MVKKFEVGKYYRWIGPKPKDPDEQLPNWNSEGGMDYVLDGKKLKCIVVFSRYDYCALFKGMKSFEGREGTWDWTGNLKHFEEINFIEDKQYLLEFDND